MSRARRLIMVLACASATLAACGGGGGAGGVSVVPIASSNPPIASPTPGSMQRVTFSLAIPLPAPGSSSRRRAFVSSATNAATVSVTSTSGGTANATVDLSASSSACTTLGSARTCSASITVPIGSDTFTITTYDLAPVNGAIPAGARELGIGSTTATITLSSPGVAISIGGLIANLGTLPAFSSLPSDGAIHQVPIVLAPTDFGNQPIIAGSPDPYANPIHLALTESGGSGHAILLQNGVASGTTATLLRSSDTVAVQYDGGGTAGYSIGVAVSATGATGTSTTISPLFVSGTGLSANLLTLTTAGSPVTVTISETGAPATRQYSAGATSGCTGVASVTSAAGGGASATFTVTGTATPSLAQCSVSIGDGTNFITLAITNSPGGVTPSPTPTPTATPIPTPTPTPTATPTPTPQPGTGGVTIPGASIAEIAVASFPYAMTSGPDGNIWFTEPNVGNLGVINPASGIVLAEFPSGGGVGANQGIIAGPDGALWTTDLVNATVDRVTTGQASTVFPSPMAGINPNGITSGSDGALWFTDASATGRIWSLSVSGIFTQAATGALAGSPLELVYATDGNIYFTETHDIGIYNPSTQTLVREIVIPDGDFGDYITESPDHKYIYFTAVGGTAPIIGQIAIASPTTITAITLPAGYQPIGIAAGADGAMWFADAGNNQIVRMLNAAPYTLGTVSIPTAGSSPQEIVLGHDGSLWFTESGKTNVGHLIP